MSIVKEPASINQILTDKNSPLAKIIKKSVSLQDLNQLFQNILNNDLSKHCQIAQFAKKTLTLIVDNASWATNLRYAIPDIIKLLRTQPEFKNLKNIRYKINRHTELPALRPTRKNSENMQNASKLRELAVQLGKNKCKKIY
jgi:hypothetical protein